MSDRDPQWLDCIPQIENMNLTPSASKAVPRPKLYKTDPEETVSRDLSLRISSIRECFEESGILLVEKDGQLIQGMALIMFICSNKSRLTTESTLLESVKNRFIRSCVRKF